MLDTAGNSCCPAKSYLTSDGNCQTCSEELSCDTVGTDVASLKVAAGLWRPTLATLTTLECYNTAACKGGIAKSSVSDYCNDGYTGPCKYIKQYTTCSIYDNSIRTHTIVSRVVQAVVNTKLLIYTLELMLPIV
jgi:hypothetical protein